MNFIEGNHSLYPDEASRKVSVRLLRLRQRSGTSSRARKGETKEDCLQPDRRCVTTPGPVAVSENLLHEDRPSMACGPEGVPVIAWRKGFDPDSAFGRVLLVQASAVQAGRPTKGLSPPGAPVEILLSFLRQKAAPLSPGLVLLQQESQGKAVSRRILDAASAEYIFFSKRLEGEQPVPERIYSLGGSDYNLGAASDGNGKALLS